MFGVHPTTSHYDRASWNETLYGEAAFASKGGSVPTLFEPPMNTACGSGYKRSLSQH